MTIKDIAKLSGYAVGTVSRVLNNRPDVSEEARAKVMAVVEAHHFTRNSNAKHLKQQASSGVALIVKGTQNMLFADLVERIQTRIRDSGHPSLIYYIDEDDDEIDQAIQVCRERRPLGILFLGSNLSLFQAGFARITIPCVLVTNSAAGLDLPNLSSVSTDDTDGACQAVERLMDLGHCTIGILGGRAEQSNAAQARLEGVRQAFARRGLTLDEGRQCETARFDLSGGYAAMERLLDKLPGMTAVFAMSDVQALGAMRALHDRGLRVPEDISILGYDGIVLGRYAVPRLSTVRQDAQRLAERSVDLLIHQIQDGAKPAHELIPYTFLEGESVKERT